MKLTPEVSQPSAWARVGSSTKTQLRNFRGYIERRVLEGNVASLVDAARSHQSNGTPPGSAVYLVLHREARLLCDAYCERWGVKLDKLYAELPGLCTLRDLAEGAPTPSRSLKALLLITAVLGGGFLIGVTGACMRLGFHLLGGAR